jgi:hypothetical protein
VSAPFCLHCGEHLHYHPASPRGPKGWEHAGSPQSDHAAIPADLRTESDERARQKSQEAILRHLGQTSNYVLYNTFDPDPKTLFNDRRN